MRRKQFRNSVRRIDAEVGLFYHPRIPSSFVPGSMVRQCVSGVLTTRGKLRKGPLENGVCCMRKFAVECWWYRPHFGINNNGKKIFGPRMHQAWTYWTRFVPPLPLAPLKWNHTNFAAVWGKTTSIWRWVFLVPVQLCRERYRVFSNVSWCASCFGWA